MAMTLFVTGIVRRLQVLRKNADHLVRREALADRPPGRDEIGRLGEALTHSASILAAQEAELRKLNHELNLTVAERTQQLDQEMVQRRRSEEQLRQSQKMDAIGRLAGGIAHDFNNALTLVIGYGQLLSDRLPPDPETREAVDEILRAADHAASLTRQFLAFSRREMVQSQNVDLNKVVSRVEKLLARLIGENIHLEAQLHVKVDAILADEGQIEQVIINLAVNARDAMPGGGNLTIGTANVELDEEFARAHLGSNPARHVMLLVSDSGHGMTEEVRAKIFEPFFTTKEQGKGTGLGLSIVYGIVKQFGGTIWVYSEVGVGTTFKIYFPAVSDAAEPHAVADRPVVHLTDTRTILLVEDEPAVRKLTREMLVRRGYLVLEAESPDTARRSCREHPSVIDLLLTDVIMPKTNGRDLARELQKQRPDMKVLFMSGFTDGAITRHGVLDAGAEFIEKPFSPDRLTTRIRDVIGGASA